MDLRTSFFSRDARENGSSSGWSPPYRLFGKKRVIYELRSVDIEEVTADFRFGFRKNLVDLIEISRAKDQKPVTFEPDVFFRHFSVFPKQRRNTKELGVFGFMLPGLWE
jgi:hypothetical protein